MKKLLTAFLLLGFISANSQDFGLSFSYFLPKNGYFSTPISPFSLRGVGIDLNKIMAIETGITLYRMSGLNLKDLPLESKSPLLGPNFTIFIPAELVFQFKGSRAQFDIKGGGFVFYGFDQRLMEGNIDRAIRKYESWTVANSDLSFENNPGFGYHGGVELTIYVTSQVGVSLETNYLIGEAKFPMKGTYTGGTTTIETKTADYADAKVDFTGLEFSVGLIFTGGGGKAQPKKKRRR
jgi:hypothetical protein